MFGWGTKRPASTLTGEWARAEEIAWPWVKRNCKWKPRTVEADARWPYMLCYDPCGTVLVHDGQVIAHRAGLDALATYLRGIHLLDRDDLDATLLLEIVGYFGAYGPDSYQTWYYERRTLAPAELYPRLERDADGVRLILHYPNRIDAPAGMCVLRPDFAFYSLDRWTLTIPRDYALSWKKEYIELPRPEEYR